LPEADLAWFANNLKMPPGAATPEITFTPAASHLRPCCEKGLRQHSIKKTDHKFTKMKKKVHKIFIKKA